MNTDLSFITNEENQSLKERFRVLIKDTSFFDCLVGYCSPPAGSTFHGRDIFAPLAGLISLKGIEEAAGKKLSPILLKSLQPVIDRKAHSLTGKIIHIDRFGNCISSISINDFLALTKPDNKKTATIRVGGIKIKGIMNYFSQVSKGVPLSYFGSAGFLEIAVNMGNASEVLKIKLGDKVSVYY